MTKRRYEAPSPFEPEAAYDDPRKGRQTQPFASEMIGACRVNSDLCGRFIIRFP